MIGFKPQVLEASALPTATTTAQGVDNFMLSCYKLNVLLTIGAIHSPVYELRINIE